MASQITPALLNPKPSLVYWKCPSHSENLNSETPGIGNFSIRSEVSVSRRAETLPPCLGTAKPCLGTAKACLGTAKPCFCTVEEFLAPLETENLTSDRITSQSEFTLACGLKIGTVKLGRYASKCMSYSQGNFGYGTSELCHRIKLQGRQQCTCKDSSSLRVQSGVGTLETAAQKPTNHQSRKQAN